jgi:putative hydrolase of the HAD superfamily
MAGLVLVFDLDDTLYDEMTFVKSGFRAVAGYLGETGRIPATKALEFMEDRLKQGREGVFDDLLREYGIFSKRLVRKCLAVYRSHKPEITLAPDAGRCLARFVHYPKYIVTDGNKLVQANKIRALGLEDKVVYAYITHRYGLKHAKPSPYCFLKICEREGVPPSRVVYFGDNPHKDFAGIKPLGFKTVRVLKGPYRLVEKEKEYEAGRKVCSLDEVDEEFLRNL